MKTKRFILSLVLCLCAFLPLFSLAGCGNVTISDVKTSFADLDATYNEYATVFVNGSLEDGKLQTKYLVRYGFELDSVSIPETKEKFDALEDKYNVMLAISSQYIDSNKAYIAALEDKELSNETRDALKELNESLTAYRNYIYTFIDGRTTFKTHFEKHAGNVDADLAVLRSFKKVYGGLVDRNLNLALSVAKVIETTEIYDLLQSTQPTVDDTTTVREYLAVKMLPIFNELLIAETETAFSYDDYDGAAKDRLEVTLDKLEALFANFKTRLASSASTERPLANKEEMQKLFNTADNFFVEMDIYLSCIENLNIYDLIVEHKTFEEHEKHVEFASIYFEKIDQFVSFTLDDYMNDLLKMIYEA